MNIRRKPIVVVGSINIDLVARTPRIPLPGETITGSGFETTPGGKGANQAVAAARLGYPVAMLGMVGEDVFGAALVENLASAGVNTDSIARVSGPSGVAQIQVADNGQNSIIVVSGANSKVDAAFIDSHADKIRSAGMVLCQLEIPLSAIERTVTICADAGVPVMLDPAPAAPLPDDLWNLVTWFTPNEIEADRYITPTESTKDAAQKFFAKGVQGVVLKRGAEGAYIAPATGRAAWIRSFPVKPTDTVAAGDCFNGAFAVALMEGELPPAAGRFAAAAAAISVTRRGAQASMPSRSEVEEFLRTNV